MNEVTGSTTDKPKGFFQNSSNICLLIFIFLTLAWVGVQLFFGLKYKLHKVELLEISLFGAWALLVGSIDIKTKRIPLWTTGSVIVGVLIWRFTDHSGLNGVLGLGIKPIEAAMGVVFGFLISDMITHYGNWLAKFPKSPQGLLPIWMAIPLLLTICLLPADFLMENNMLIVSGVALLALRLALEFFHRKQIAFQKIVDLLLSNALITYSTLFVLLVTFAVVSVNNLDYFNSASIRTELIIFVLCISFALEEIIVPLIYKIFRVSTSAEAELEEKPSIMGGGDVLVNAAIGGLWGPREINACLLFAFLFALIVVGIMKLINFLKKKEIQSSLQEMAFAPFIIFSAQLILFLEIMFRAPK